MADFLPIDTIHELKNAGIEAGLATPTSRALLMAGISRRFVAQIATPPGAGPGDQLELDLLAMNNARLRNGEIPLERWLTNAVLRVQTVEQEVFRAALDQVADQAEQENPRDRPPGGEERIVHGYDLLPYGYLAGALATGAAVARLTVTRHERGQPVAAPGTAVPWKSAGTGWLVAPDLLVTNHHVVNFRSPSEEDASPDDLTLQATGAVVEFDVDQDGVQVPAVQVESLAVHDKALDYAVLQLAEPSERRPLRLAPTAAIVAAAEAQSPVNIIQHPGGGPKTLGIRNNLIASHDDTDLRYFTDTLEGSSGSPVCTDDWQVVALHKAWTRVAHNISFQGKETAWVNRGTRIDRVAEDLRTKAPDTWSKVESP